MKTKQMRIGSLALATACYLIGGCATVQQAGAKHGTAIGCGAGAVFGGMLGNVIGKKTGNRALATAAGAAVGTALGCYVGNRWQKRERALQELAAREHMIIVTETLATRAPDNDTGPKRDPKPAGLVANVQEEGMFASDSDQFSASGLRRARELAAIYRPDPQDAPASGQPHPVLLVVGHTDASGSAASNQQLSERRAHAMGQVLADEGIDPRYVYFQGAGASRPVADNTTPEGRARNRRVEIVELASADLLTQRVSEERTNLRYLAHGTATEEHVNGTIADARPSNDSAHAASPSQRNDRSARHESTAPRDFVDFGGVPASGAEWDLAQLIKPQSTGFSLIGTAQAAPAPLRSCEADRPRIAGVVRNLASGQTLDARVTRDYLPGMNGRAWAGLVNGNLVTLSPVAVLRDDAQVASEPKAFVTPGYSQGFRKVIVDESAVANTYEGEDNILYRVFVRNPSAPMKCMDVVMPKVGGEATGGKLYYAHGDRTYVADFKPVRS